MIAFSPYNIGSVRIKNRFIRSATLDYCGEQNGFCSELYTRYLERIASGGAGLICTAPAAIHTNFRVNQFQLSIFSQEAADSYKPMIERIHAHGAKILLYPDCSNKVIAELILSIKHNGLDSRIKAFKNMQTWVTSGLTGAEIAEIVNLYKEAIVRAKEVGFDGIFLNATFGAFLQNMTSRKFNHRQDQWGGSLSKRLKVIKEILLICKELDFSVLVRWDVKDYKPGGVIIEESIETCKLLESYGADALEVAAFCSIESIIALNNDIEGRESIPFTETNDTIDYVRIMHAFAQNSFFVKEQKDIKLPMEYIWGNAYYNVQPIKESLNIPVSLFGGLRSLKTAENILKGGISDFISLIRVLIYNPAQCHDFEEGGALYSSCISCNCCMYKMFLSLEDPSVPYLHHCVLKQN